MFFFVEEFLEVHQGAAVIVGRSIRRSFYRESTEYIFEGVEFVLKSFQIADKVSMLLRLNFLASRKRVSFMQKHAPDVYVLPKRPSFKKTAKSSTDACDYGWFVWDSKIERASGNIYFLNV